MTRAGFVGLIILALTVLAAVFDVQNGLCRNMSLFCPEDAESAAPYPTQPSASEPNPAPPWDYAETIDVAERACEEAERVDTRVAWETFLAQHPHSPCAIRAHERVRQVSQRDEEEAWRAAASYGTLDAYSTYLNLYPQGAHAVEARDAIRRLQQAEIDMAWRTTVADGSAGAYRQFLLSYPNSAYDAHAREALRAHDAAAQEAAATALEQSCRAWSERAVPRSNPVSSGIAGCIIGLLADDCQREAQRAAQEAQWRRQQEDAQRSAEYQRCMRNGGPTSGR